MYRDDDFDSRDQRCERTAAPRRGIGRGGVRLIGLAVVLGSVAMAACSADDRSGDPPAGIRSAAEDDTVVEGGAPFVASAPAGEVADATDTASGGEPLADPPPDPAPAEGAWAGASAEPVDLVASSPSWTVPAERGGNGDPNQVMGQADCFQRVLGYYVCFQLENATTRLTAIRGQLAKFPLTVSKFFTGGDNAELGGLSTGGYYGWVEWGDGSTYCRQNCPGRLRPNPFNESAVMSFRTYNGWAGVTTRLFVGSGLAPMSLNQTGAQPYYDLPTTAYNYGWCDQGAFFACRALDIPGSGIQGYPRYQITTHPLEVQITNTLTVQGKPPFTLVRQGEANGTGLLLDRSIAADPPQLERGATARQAGYRATDGRTATFTTRYLVGDATGRTDSAACTGCGTSVIVNVEIAKDGKETHSCNVNPTSNQFTVLCDVVVTGAVDSVMTALVTIRNF